MATKTVERKNTTITIIIPDPEVDPMHTTGDDAKDEEAFCAICQDEPIVAICRACKRSVGMAHFHPICLMWNDLCRATKADPRSGCGNALRICTECAAKRGGPGR